MPVCSIVVREPTVPISEIESVLCSASAIVRTRLSKEMALVAHSQTINTRHPVSTSEWMLRWSRARLFSTLLAQNSDLFLEVDSNYIPNELPEATMHKNCTPKFRKNYVWGSGQLTNVEAKAKACRMKPLPHKHFRPCIRRANSGHHFGSCEGLPLFSQGVPFWTSRRLCW